MSTICADVEAAAALYAAAEAETSVPAAVLCAAKPTDKVVELPKASCAREPCNIRAPHSLLA